MKTLVIAEKPSVAQDIVRALAPVAGRFDKHEDHFENEQYVVTSAVGHLLEIQAPEAFDVKRGKWSFAHLPVIPPHFDLKPVEKTKSRLAAVVKQARRKDVGRLVNACDAGREGELIFRLIAQYAFDGKHAPKPVERLWLQSMTPQAIREGFGRLRSDAQMQGLADAARSRSEADWLVGINGTRAMTAFNSQGGGFFLTTVGRVQTPTLAIVVDREEQIRKHVPRDYWEVHATFLAQAGSYQGRWFDPDWKKDPQDAEKRPERLWSADEAALTFWLAMPLTLNPYSQLMSGAIIFGACFIATDPVTAATTPRGRFLYGILVGALAIAIRNLGNFPDGVAFAILIANGLVPLIDPLTQPRYR